MIAVGCDICIFGPEQPPEEVIYDHVMLLYSAGFNSLSGYLAEDIEDLKQGYVPGEKEKNVLLVASHRPDPKLQTTTPTSPYLIRMYKDKNLQVVCDTLLTLDPSAYLTKVETLTELLNYVHDSYKSESYGMIYSSHATGWLPMDFYAHPKYARRMDGAPSYAPARWPSGAVPYVEPEPLPGPAVKSLGQTRVKEDDGEVYSYEMELADFAAAIPYHLDYILFDACFMGCVEVAWQLKGVCSKIVVSQAEVLAEGLDYTKLASHIFEGETIDLRSVCSDYFDYYDAQKGEYRSATISLIDCEEMDALAGICKSLFSKYHREIEVLSPSIVQRYFRSTHHWFFDLEDILLKAGISSAEAADLSDALRKCVIYKNATPDFMPNSGGFPINHFSGLSMYLPNSGTDYLSTFYKSLDWNIATELVEY